MKSEIRSNTLTSYDLLKAFAVIIMVIDHLGAYSFVDSDWMRAIGRIGFPVWFFLVGYARGRDISSKLLGGALILLCANLITGMPVFPLNALFSIIFIRLVIDYFAQFCSRNTFALVFMGLTLFILAFPTDLLTEYGTMGLITAIYGYYVRHKSEIIKQKGSDHFVVGFMLFSFFVFIIYQQISFGFTSEQFAVMALGTLIVRLVLLYFDRREYVELTARLPGIVNAFIRLCGRRTLEIYVIHLIMFKFISLWLGYDGFGLFDLKLFDPNLVEFFQEA